MILVEVYFAELNRSYDFKLDEDVPIGGLIEDMVSVIAQKEYLFLDRQAGQFLLCSKRQQRCFDLNTSLAQNRVRSGDSLLLV